MGWERILKEEKRWVITLYFWTDEGTFFWRVLEKYNETREFEGTLEEAQDYAHSEAKQYLDDINIESSSSGNVSFEIYDAEERLEPLSSGKARFYGEPEYEQHGL